MGSTHYAVTEEALLKDEFLAIVRLGIRERMPAQMVHRPWGTPDVLFMVFHTPARLVLSDATELVPADTMIIWPALAPHHYGHGDGSWIHSWLHARGRVLEELLRDSQLPLGRPFPVGARDVVPRYLRGIYRELRDHPVCDPVIVRNLVDSLLRELTRRHRSASLGAPRPLLDARAYLDAHFAEPIRLADLARRAGYSVSHFSALFKAHFGTSPIDYLVRLRLRAAAYLLRDVNVSVSSAAASVGYDDLYYFSKLFKKKLGVSPRAYRKKLRGG